MDVNIDILDTMFQDDAPITIGKNSVDTTVDRIMGDPPRVGIRIVDSAIGKNEGNVITCSSPDQIYELSDNDDATRNGLFPTKGKKKNTLSDGTTITGPPFDCP